MIQIKFHKKTHKPALHFVFLIVKEEYTGRFDCSSIYHPDYFARSEC